MANERDMFHAPTQEEEKIRRQSAPRPTAEDALRDAQANINPQMVNPMGAGNGTATEAFSALTQPIGSEAIHKFNQILSKYKSGKANLEKRIIENERWYKVRHWECMRGEKDDVEPSSAWLFNCLANKHADAMDNYPTPNILPREESDRGEAEMLTSIVPVILEQTDFEETYDEIMSYKFKFGTGVYGVFWDSGKLNGLGDVTVKKIDLLNLFWESGVTDIQKSRYMFYVELMDNDMLMSMYPQTVGHLGNGTVNVAEYVYDDTVDTSEKTAVIDVYYRKTDINGKNILHYAKYCSDIVLFATENTPEFKDRGLYDHGEYPFIFDPLFRTEGTPTGFGYIDIGKSCQEYIDRGNKAIMSNMLVNATPRHFVADDSKINEEEYADLTKPFVHVQGRIDNDSISPIPTSQLAGIYVDILNSKIDELKETTGNRDISTGGTSSGVTAASAIAAMQEAGSKLSRDANKASYRAFRNMVLMVIELIRQFYDLPRCFRIMGNDGAMRFVQYSNARIAPQAQGYDFGVDMGMRLPIFDVEVTAQKQSPYTKMSQNELALQFYTAGFFNPQQSDQALACLDMMDFDRKHFVMEKIQQNSAMYQQMMMLAQMVDKMRGGNEISMSLAQQYGMPLPMGMKEAPNLDGNKEEASNTKNARQRVAESTAPR